MQVLPSQTGLCLKRVSFELSENRTSVRLGAYGSSWKGNCLTGAPRFTIALGAPLGLRALLHSYIDEPGYVPPPNPLAAPTADNPTGVSAGWSTVGVDPLRIFEVAQDQDAVQLRMLIRLRQNGNLPISCGLGGTAIEEIYLNEPLGSRLLLHA